MDKKNSVYFEILEIIGLLIIVFVLYKQKQYILSFVFGLQLLEHISQIIFCYRQSLNSLQIITIIIDLIFLIYSYYIKCYWTIPLFLLGIYFHVVSLFYNKSLVDIVCLDIKNL